MATTYKLAGETPRYYPDLVPDDPAHGGEWEPGETRTLSHQVDDPWLEKVAFDSDAPRFTVRTPTDPEPDKPRRAAGKKEA